MKELDESEEFQSPSLPIFVQKLKSMNELFDNQMLKYFNEEIEDYVKIFLIGYPSDIGALNCMSRTGAEQGPSNFREIFQLLKTGTANAFFQVNISEQKMKIFDCGDIKFEPFNLKQAQDELKKVVRQISNQIKQSKIIVIGGTDDLLFPVLEGFSESSSKVNLMNIDSQIDIKAKFRKQFDELEPEFHEHHQSHFRMIYEDSNLLDKIENIIHLGLLGQKVSFKHVEYAKRVSKVQSQLIYLDKDIRRGVIEIDNKQAFTQAGFKVSQILKQFNSQPLICNIDLSTIKSEYFPGVSEPNPSMGLSVLEIEEIAHLIGQYKESKVICISEYNPAIEKYTSGTILNNIFQSFIFGVGKSLQNDNIYQKQ